VEIKRKNRELRTRDNDERKSAMAVAMTVAMEAAGRK